MQPKPQGYGDDFTAKCGHCNGIHVNGIHARGNSAKSFALATKKTMTYYGKCICLFSKTTPLSSQLRTEIIVLFCLTQLHTLYIYTIL